jgi:5-methylcytosine-specific restriction endonuclease McrA
VAIQTARDVGFRLSRRDVYSVHGPWCHICAGFIDRDLPAGNMMRGSIDHLVPVTKGGRHELANLRPAHVLCNSLKGDVLPSDPGYSEVVARIVARVGGARARSAA